MKIPVSDFSPEASRPVATPYGNQNFDTGEGAIIQGVGQLGQGLGHVAQAYQAHVQRAQKDNADNGIAQLVHGTTGLLAGDSAVGSTQVIGNDGSTGGPGDAAIDGAGAKTIDTGLTNQGTPRGYLSTEGVTAAGQAEPTMKAWAKLRDKIKEGLGSDGARALFDEQAKDVENSTFAKVETHASQQIKAAHVATTKAVIESSLNNAATFPGLDPESEKANAANFDRAAQRIHQEQLSPEQGTQAIADLKGQFAAARLTSLLSPEKKDWESAQTLFDREKDNISEPLRRHFAQTIDETKRGQLGELGAQSIFAGAVNKSTGWVDPIKARTAVDAMKAGPLQDETRQRVEQRLAQAQHQKQQAGIDAFNRALSAYEKSGTLTAVNPADKAWLLDPANDAAMHWHQLREMAHGDALHAAGAPPTVAQQTAMTRFLVDLHDHPDQYATMPVETFNAKWLSQLAPVDRERAGAQLAQMHGNANKPEKLSPLEDKMLLQMGRDAKVFPDAQNDVSKWGDEDAKVFYEAQQKLSDKAAEWKRANGKSPPIDEVKKWAGDLLLKGKIPGTGAFGLFKTGTTAIQAGMSGTGFEPAWSSDEKAQAENSLRKAGAPFDETTVDMYLRRKHSLPALPQQAGDAAAPEEDLLTPLTRPRAAPSDNSKGAF